MDKGFEELVVGVGFFYFLVVRSEVLSVCFLRMFWSWERILSRLRRRIFRGCLFGFGWGWRKRRLVCV